MSAAAELKAVRNEHTRAVLAKLIVDSGINGAIARGYLAARMRWHLGLRKGHVTPPSAALRPDELAFIERRAWELLDGARHLLPALQREETGRHDDPAAEPAPRPLEGIGIPADTVPNAADLPANVTPITAARRRA